MKQLVFIVAMMVFLVCCLSPAVLAEDLPQVTCEAYVVMDADTGQIIMEKNPDEILFPASITKIMTLALTMEKPRAIGAPSLLLAKRLPPAWNWVLRTLHCNRAKW